MTMEQAFQTFIEESFELLQEMEGSLLGMERSDDRNESVNSVFRAAHTIKGSAGLFGFDGIVAFTHVVESVLDRVRSGEVILQGELVSLMLECKDYIEILVEAIKDGEQCEKQGNERCEKALVERLNLYLSSSHLDELKGNNVPAVRSNEVAFDGAVTKSDEFVESENWHISVHFGEDVLRNGMDPLSFLRYLKTLGTIQHVATLSERLPEAENMDPESCYLGFEISFSSDSDKQAIEDVFEFVREDCRLHIIPPHSRIDEFIKIIDALPGNQQKLGEILVACGTLTDRELNIILEVQQRFPEQRPLTGELAVEAGMASPEVVEAALNKQGRGGSGVGKRGNSVRIDAEKLDNLINLIGELVIAGASIESEVRAVGIESLTEASLPMVRLIEEVRDSALNLRMVQIGDTFNRFQRVVRDVSMELGKNIELAISGGETELDKSVIEKITDPLTHLVRNAVDHGIEGAEDRARMGKPAVGRVGLNAYHESGSIVIEVTDDGGGLDRQRILAKAQERGLVGVDAELSEQEIYQLIFEAGFSTASEISNISGRGVGMDVVRKNIEALRGTIEIFSEQDKGTTMRIRLPLTLAIIDGFLVGVGESAFVVPLDIVEECIELTPDRLADHHGRNFITLRGEPLPFIKLRDVFKERPSKERRQNVVVVRFGTQRAGFVVDQLMGEFQTVIKPLGAIFQNLKGISGSTILGSGEVALILDAPALIQMAGRERADEHQHRASTALH